MSGLEGIRAFHGSPHDFDRFDIAHLGEGEGAQAFGHGLYFAENEDVARGYRNTLSGQLRINDEDASAVPSIVQQAARAVANGTVPDVASHLADLEARHARAEARYKEAKAKGEIASAGLAKHNMNMLLDQLEGFRPLAGAKVGVNKGRMYEVRLKVRPDDLLDFDAPRSAQPDAVQRFLRKHLPARRVEDYQWHPEEAMHGGELHYLRHPDDEHAAAYLERDPAYGRYELKGLPRRSLLDPLTLDDAKVWALRSLSERLERDKGVTGKQLHERLAGNRLNAPGRGGGAAALASELLKAGVPGIRYLDGFSRYREDGDPTRNYVSFHHDPVEIVRKYYQGGLA